MTKLDSIKKHGIAASGRKELLKYLDGARITQRQAILAKCYDCMAYYADGRNDCKVLDCPLYPFMPYSSRPQKPSKKLSEVHKARLKAGKQASNAVELLSEGVLASE